MPNRQANPLLLVTRPQPQADQWVQQLQSNVAGVQVMALPLIEVQPVQQPHYQQQLQQTWQQLPQWHAAMFVSPAAVQHFFTSHAQALTQWLAANIRAWAPGRGTVKALLAQGVPIERIDAPDAQSAQFDSEALWPVVRPQLQAGMRILRVRGTDQLLADGVDQGTGRDWLADELQALQVQADTVVAYQRSMPLWTADQIANLQSQSIAQAIWLFSSSQAIDHLHQLMPSQSWQAATALTTHPRIGERAAHHGFGQIVATRPTWQDVAQSLQLCL